MNLNKIITWKKQPIWYIYIPWGFVSIFLISIAILLDQKLFFPWDFDQRKIY